MKSCEYQLDVGGRGPAFGSEAAHENVVGLDIIERAWNTSICCKQHLPLGDQLDPCTDTLVCM